MNPENGELRLEIILDPLILLDGRLKLLRSKQDTKHGRDMAHIYIMWFIHFICHILHCFNTLMSLIL